ncbi:MAG TPA: MoxR family ATPase [Planctomycetota bacterium]|nr:MoxR family ATPase [Planctomycetota bacterium]
MAENDIARQAQQFREDFARLRAEVGKVIVGHGEIVDGVLIALFAGGHVLLEGVPGLGKTLLVRTLADALELQFSRIQFTPDLMPADVIGTNLVVESAPGRREFKFQPGPVFAQIVLVDEINRATPKTQSALLEAMQEHRVTAGGETRTLTEPFFVLATQNPLEMEGTYPLPEAQLDRFFFKLMVEYSTREELSEVLRRTTEGVSVRAGKVLDGERVLQWQRLVREVILAPHVKDYIVRLVLATHPKGQFAPEKTNRYVRYGASPRASQALALAGKIRALLDGRYNVAFEDVAAAAKPALRHRLILNFEGEAEGVSPDSVIEEIIEKTPRQAEDIEKVLAGAGKK